MQQYVWYNTSNSCNIGTSALHDMYAQAQGQVQTYQAMHEFLCCNYYVTLPGMLLYLYPYVFNLIMGCNVVVIVPTVRR